MSYGYALSGRGSLYSCSVHLYACSIHLYACSGRLHTSSGFLCARPGLPRRQDSRNAGPSVMPYQ